jgi:hypothetical protein
MLSTLQPARDLLGQSYFPDSDLCVAGDSSRDHRYGLLGLKEPDFKGRRHPALRPPPRPPGGKGNFLPGG